MERRPSSRQTACSSSSIPRIPPLRLPPVELRSQLSAWTVSGDTSPTSLRAQRLSWLMLEDTLPTSILGQLAPWALRDPLSLPEWSESPSRVSLREGPVSRPMSEYSSQTSQRDEPVLPTMNEPPSFPQFNITPPYSTPEEQRSLATLADEPPRALVREQDGTELETMPGRKSAPGEKYDSPKLSSSTEDDGEPKEGEESGDYIDGFKLAAVLISTTIVFFLLLLDNSIISTAVPQITSDFHSLADVGWYGGAYQLSSAALQPLTGKLYTHLSSKWTFLGFFFLFEVGSLICGVATSSTMFILGRAVAGIGGSGLQNGALSVIAGAVSFREATLYTGLLLAFGQLGLVVGPLIGGALTEYTTWRWCFYINLPAGAVAAVLIVFTHVPEQIVKPKASWSLMRRILPQLDLPGFALFAPAAIMLLLALQYGSQGMPWSSATIIGLLCGAVATFIVFFVWESRIGDKAMIPFSMIKNRVIWTSNIQFSCLMTTVFVGSQYMPIYFQSVKGATATLSGVYMLPSIISQLLLIILSGVLITRFGYYLPWAAFAGAGTAVASGLISTWNPYTETGRWIGYQILYGARGCGVQPSVIAVQNALPPSQSAVGIAFLVFCQNFLAAVFVVVANTIFTETLSQAIVELAPSVDPAAAMAAGGSAEAVRNLVPAGSPELDGVLRAFARSFDMLCYLMVAAAVVSFAASWGMGWVDVRKKKQPATGDA